MSEEKKFMDGIWFNEPRDNAPSFVLGSISIDRIRLLQALSQTQGDKVRLNVKRSKNGSVYCEIDTYVKPADSQQQQYNPVGYQKPQQQQGYQPYAQSQQGINQAVQYVQQMEQQLKNSAYQNYNPQQHQQSPPQFNIGDMPFTGEGLAF